MSANTPTADLFRSERMRRRRIVNRLVEVAATVAALLAVAVLVIVVSSVVRQRLGRDQRRLLHEDAGAIYTGFGPRPASGIENAIIGTLIIIGIALVMALPVGVLTAIYLNELAPRKLAGVLTLAFDVLNGIPAIVLGIFVFIFVVVGHGQAAWKASFALAILMVPMIARSTQEVLALVPASMREASLALGRRQMANDPERRPPAGGGRNRHRRDPRHRACGRRDGAAPLHERALQRLGQLRPHGSPSPRSRCSSSPQPSRPTRCSTSRRGAPPRF